MIHDEVEMQRMFQYNRIVFNKTIFFNIKRTQTFLFVRNLLGSKASEIAVHFDIHADVVLDVISSLEMELAL